MWPTRAGTILAEGTAPARALRWEGAGWRHSEGAGAGWVRMA